MSFFHQTGRMVGLWLDQVTGERTFVFVDAIDLIVPRPHGATITTRGSVSIDVVLTPDAIVELLTAGT